MNQVELILLDANTGNQVLPGVPPAFPYLGTCPVLVGIVRF